MSAMSHLTPLYRESGSLFLSGLITSTLHPATLCLASLTTSTHSQAFVYKCLAAPATRRIHLTKVHGLIRTTNPIHQRW